jgi:hypothetical protein
MAELEDKPDKGPKNLITILINGIAHQTREHTLTVSQVLALAGFTTEDYTLVRKEAPSVALPVDEVLHLKDGNEFLALRKTNPVSELSNMRDLELFFSERLGRMIEYVDGGNGKNLIIHDVLIPVGPLAGKVCDIGIQYTDSTPFNPFPAFHTRPALVAVNTNSTQAGRISAEWQYWSRQWTKPPLSPDEVWAWILTALTQATI